MAMAIGEMSQRCQWREGLGGARGRLRGGGQEAGGRQAASSACGVWAVGGGRLPMLDWKLSTLLVLSSVVRSEIPCPDIVETRD